MDRVIVQKKGFRWRKHGPYVAVGCLQQLTGGDPQEERVFPMHIGLDDADGELPSDLTGIFVAEPD